METGGLEYICIDLTGPDVISRAGTGRLTCQGYGPSPTRGTRPGWPGPERLQAMSGLGRAKNPCFASGLRATSQMDIYAWIQCTCSHFTMALFRSRTPVVTSRILKLVLIHMKIAKFGHLIRLTSKRKLRLGSPWNQAQPMTRDGRRQLWMGAWITRAILAMTQLQL